MRREEWLDREIRTMVQGVHRVLGVGNADDAPMSPLTISGDALPEEDTTDPASLLADDAATDNAATPPPAPETGSRRAARRKHKHAKH